MKTTKRRTAGMAALLVGMMSLEGSALVATRRDRPSSQDSGAIAGVVVGDPDARPLRNAYVLVVGTETGTLRIASTNANGEFSVRGLAADRYTVGASKSPYLGAVAGAKRPAHPGTPIALGAGQSITDVIIRLTPGSVIAGTIRDDAGRPAANTLVRLQQWRMQGAERTLVPVGSGRVVTDERGRYRLYGLAPGPYVLGATPPTLVAGRPRRLSDADVDSALRGLTPPAAAADAADRYAPVYFPGTPRAADAQSIVVGPGETRDDIDLRLVLTRVAKIDGTVALGDGRPTPGLVFLMNALPGGSTSNSTFAARAGADGRFAFADVVPGTYVLGASPQGVNNDQFAMTTVVVSGADVSGVDLVFSTALRLSGRIVFAGAAPAPALAGLRIALQPLAGVPAVASPTVAPTDASGGFSIRGLTPGRYVLAAPIVFGAAADSLTWTLDSVLIAGKNVTDLPFEVTSDSAASDAVMTLTDRWQSLAGTLRLASGAASDDTVVVFPADQAYWLVGSRRIRVTRPNSDGTFVIGGRGVLSLPAGAYLVAAVPDLDRDEQFDSSFLASILPAAVPVMVLPGEKKVQNLSIR